MPYKVINFGSKAIKEIPVATTHLDLSWSGLGNKPVQNVCDVFAFIPPSITHLNLSANDLENLSTEDCIRLMKAIPVTVKALYLDANKLGHRNAKEFASIIAAVLPRVTLMSLSFNGIRYQSEEEWQCVLGALPKTVTELNISYNQLGILFPLALMKIPNTLKALNTSANDLYKVERSQLITALGFLSPELQTLDLRQNYLGIAFNPQQLAEVVDAIKARQCVIDLRQNAISESNASYLSNQVQSRCSLLLSDQYSSFVLKMRVVSQFGAIVGVSAVALALHLLSWAALDETATPVMRGSAGAGAALLLYGVFSYGANQNTEHAMQSLSHAP